MGASRRGESSNQSEYSEQPPDEAGHVTHTHTFSRQQEKGTCEFDYLKPLDDRTTIPLSEYLRSAVVREKTNFQSVPIPIATSKGVVTKLKLDKDLEAVKSNSPQARGSIFFGFGFVLHWWETTLDYLERLETMRDPTCNDQDDIF